MSDALRALQVAGVRQQAGFIICYGPQRAITQPWNGTSAANIHFSVTKSTLCLLAETEASASSTLVFSADHPNKTTAPEREKHQESVDL